MLTDVVWFGEVPYNMEEIDRIVRKADLAIVVGTSSTVRRAEKCMIETNVLMSSSAI